jgi:hypothetical protein
MFNLITYIMKRKTYLLVFMCVFCVAGLFAQDTLHVGESLYHMILDADDGATIIVASGLHDAQDQSIMIANKSLTIKGEEGEEKPLMYVEEFDVSGTDVDIILEGIEFSGATLIDSLTGEEDVEDLESSYLINLEEQTHVSTNNIIIRNCIVRNFERSAIRGDRSPEHTADSIIIDNSILYDFRGGGDYGPFRFKSRITINAFVIRNSTLYNFFNKLIDFQDIVPSQMDITVENCTFYNWGGGTKDGQYLFDIQDNTQARLYIKSCILGKTNTTDTVTVRAFRFPDGGLDHAEITNSALTPDFIVDPVGSIDSIEWDKKEWNEKDFDPEFEDPENGNFNIPEDSPIRQMSPTGGPIGDPRWVVMYSGISELKNIAQIQVYPSPADNILNIKTEGPCIVAIYNTMGMKIRELSIKDSSVYTLNISDLTPGLYLIKAGNKTGIQKFLIK